MPKIKTSGSIDSNGVWAARSEGGAFAAASPKPDAPAWQRDMQVAFRTLDALLSHLELHQGDAPHPLLADSSFPILVPRSFAARMRKGDWRDPLLLQVLPLGAETAVVPGFVDDAVGDLESQPVPGLLHKYQGRALMLPASNCAVNCRYCFRRGFPYGELPKSGARWEAAWKYLEEHADIGELILSGGDPLVLDNRRLSGILEKAQAIPHLTTLRIHSRLPIVLPSRIETGLLSLLSEFASVKTLVMVVHANHPEEIRGDCAEALARLRGTGALLLNQSVLLRGVNDSAPILAELSRGLAACGVLPYYLHQLDRVKGTAHFEVPEAEGREILDSLRRNLPGYLLPRYVREEPGEPSKKPLI